MNRREFALRGLGLAGAALCLREGPLSAAETQVSKPNFIFILIDDMGWADLACYGSSFYETPHLDELARAGMMFTRAYAGWPGLRGCP